MTTTLSVAAPSPLVTVSVYTVVWSWTPRSSFASGLGSALVTANAVTSVDAELGAEADTAGFETGAPVESNWGTTRGSVLLNPVAVSVNVDCTGHAVGSAVTAKLIELVSPAAGQSCPAR